MLTIAMCITCTTLHVHAMHDANVTQHGAAGSAAFNSLARHRYSLNVLMVPVKLCLL